MYAAKVALAAAIRAWAPHGSLSESLQASVDIVAVNAEDVLHTAVEYSVALWATELNTILADLKQVAGRMSDGSNWDKDICKEASFDDVLAGGRTSLLREDNEGDAIAKLADKAKKV